MKINWSMQPAASVFYTARVLFAIHDLPSSKGS